MFSTIMIVDDSSTVRKAVSFTLENAGYRVVAAENGQDALKKMNDSRINMFVLNLRLPDMDGLELTRLLRSSDQYRFTPIIMLFAESQGLQEHAAGAAGVTGWIIKPFHPDQLINVIRNIITVYLTEDFPNHVADICYPENQLAKCAN